VTVRRISSGGPWEERVGYSRAVVAGPHVLVSGCTATVDGKLVGEGDARRQTEAALGVACRALAEAGGELEDVVRTRLYVTDIDRWAEVAEAHRALFADVRPAATMVEVSRLIDPRMLVEVELEAYVPTDRTGMPG